MGSHELEDACIDGAAGLREHQQLQPKYHSN
jgi:hypothetical protein